jgi:translocation and assembly module TamA
MRRYSAIARTVAWVLVFLAVVPSPGSRAADPQPYKVELRPSGDATLDDAVRASSTLISLRDKAPVGGFALVRRAEADLARVQDALHAFGYYNGKVTLTIAGHAISDPALPTTIDAAPATPPLPVVIAIARGPRFHFGRIEIEGVVPRAIEPRIAAAPRLTPGRDALAAEVLAAKGRLLAALREAGYPEATVTLPPAVLHPDTARLDVTFQVTTGPHADLGPIRFTGLRTVSEAFMRRRLLLHAGMPFSPSSLGKAQRDLLSLGVFSSVRILPATHLDAAGTLPVDVAVIERKRHAVDLGASYSTDLGVSLNASWRHRNLFGAAEQLILTSAVQLAGSATTKPGYQVGAQFLKPDFMRRDQTLDISLNAVKQSLWAYDQTGLIQRVGIERKLTPHWTLHVGTLSEEEVITQNDIRRDYNLFGLPVSLKYDTTNSLLDPTNGVRATVSFTPVESFGTPGGTYFLTQIAGSTYLDFGTKGRSVLALRGLVGQASGVGVFGMPPDQRFYAGGNGTVRGYRFQSLGPQFSNDRPTGGTAVSAATVEFRQRFLAHFGAVAFIDAGQISTDGQPLGQTWHLGAGVGGRYYTSIGPIRVDIAVPVDRQPGGDSFELYIGIGQAF